MWEFLQKIFRLSEFFSISQSIPGENQLQRAQIWSYSNTVDPEIKQKSFNSGFQSAVAGIKPFPNNKHKVK